MGSMVRVVQVELGEKSYPVYIGPGLLAETGRLLPEGISPRLLLVTNPTVYELYGRMVLESLAAAGFVVQVATVPDGEEYKTLEQAAQLYDAAVEAGLERDSVVLALGGGVIGDLAGFVAATYLRGVLLVHLPTTLLAQVDSSIGGKVAVNHARGKNLIGAFHQPRLVVADTSVLSTLPPGELRTGMAEVVKHGIIRSESYLELVEKNVSRIKRGETAILTEVVEGSCRIKGAVVSRDEKEEGLRMVLNFGHTVGHALEAVTRYRRYRHGEAVAIGMMAACQMGNAAAGFPVEGTRRVQALLDRLGLPTRIEGVKAEEILEHLRYDKKTKRARVRFVLPVVFGETTVTDQVSPGLVREVLHRLGAG